MKNKLEYVLCLFLLLGTATGVWADGGDSFIPTNLQGYYFSPQNLGLATPQTAEFVQYGNTGMNLYNGLLDLNIPLLDYKDPAFELDMSIQYLSDGFKPGRRPSVVGNNWILNAGGSITRNVKGTPDDIRQDQKSGLLAAIRDGKLKQYSKEDLLKINISVATNNRTYPETEYDMEPDIFNFNFGRHKGSFIIDNAGQVKCLSGGGYKIDLSGMTVQDYSTTDAPKSSSIKITTPDGYLYEFASLEYSIPNNPRKLKARPVQITSWHLTSIKDVTRNRTVFFSYENHLQKNKYHLFIYSYSVGSQWKNYVPDKDGKVKPSEVTNMDDRTNEHFVMEDKVYTPTLKSIQIDDAKIEFTTQTFPTNFFGDSDGNDLLYLSGITMSQGSNYCKTCKFDYLMKGKYFFLEKVTLQDLSDDPAVYSFDYDLSRNLPDPMTTSVDHWGFWNGRYEAIDNANTFFFDGNFGQRKAVNTEVASCNMLKKITYPTKGEEKIEYEYNRYRFYLTKNTDSFSWTTNQETYDTPCGGVRIGKLTLYDPKTGKTRKCSFQYVNPATGSESGRIGELPRYSMPQEEIQCNGYYIDYWLNSTLHVYSVSSNCIGRLNNISESPIGYSHVTETLDDGSYNRYHFSSLADIADNADQLYGVLKDNIRDLSARSFNAYQRLDKALNYAPSDLSAFRGKLLSKETYNSRSKKVAAEEYDYNFANRTSAFEVSISNSVGAFMSNKIFTTPCLMTKEKLTDENGVTVIHNFEYNDKGIVTQKETVNSNGDNVYLKYVHPGEQDGLYPENNYNRLVNENRIEEPIAVIKYLKKAGESERKIVDLIQFMYNSFEGCGLQKINLLTFKLPEPLPENTNFTDISVALKYEQSIETYHNYDRYGNIITYSINRGEEETNYIWDSPTQVAAEIKGSTYEDIKDALGMKPEEYSMNYFDKPKLEDLREKLPNAHITLYEYKPQIGVKHLSDPTGRDSFYQYNRSGRLNKTYRVEENGKLQLMEYNNYHYTE